MSSFWSSAWVSEDNCQLGWQVKLVKTQKVEVACDNNIGSLHAKISLQNQPHKWPAIFGFPEDGIVGFYGNIPSRAWEISDQPLTDQRRWMGLQVTNGMSDKRASLQIWSNNMWKSTNKSGDVGSFRHEKIISLSCGIFSQYFWFFYLFI